jgi:hypothetical protein
VIAQANGERRKLLFTSVLAPLLVVIGTDLVKYLLEELKARRAANEKVTTTPEGE